MDAEGRDKDVSFAQKKDNEEVSLTNFECALIVMIPARSGYMYIKCTDAHKCLASMIVLCHFS